MPDYADQCPNPKCLHIHPSTSVRLGRCDICFGVKKELPPEVTKPKFNIVPIENRQVAYPEAIERCERMLQELKDGTVVNVAMAFTLPNGRMGSWWSNQEKGDFLLYAGIANLFHRYGNKVEDQD